MKRDYARTKTPVQLFEEQVTRTPQHIAVVYQDQYLTYQALNAASNQLARKIQAHYASRDLHISADTLISICLDKTPELFIGMLAILKVGAAYVPIDPATPPDRMRFMLEDTHTRLLLTQQKIADGLSDAIPENTQVFLLDTINYQAEVKNNLEAYSRQSSLAYVIYTSGTTGLPKGVMITHRNVINYYVNVLRYFTEVDNVDFSTSFAFDLSVTTTLIPLLCGKKIIIYPGNLRDIEEYSVHLQNKNIDFIKSTPSFLSQVFLLPQSTRIKICFVGGEKLLPAQLHCLLNYCDAVYDEYGPTENTVGTMLIQKTNESPCNGLIGKPYANHQVYVLDENRQPVQVGVIGELYVGGAGLARGYLNQPELTQKRFIDNPFATEEDKIEGYTRLYQTGDLVRCLADGNLEYIGRNDLQVKIRGYRVELNEIEHALSTYLPILQSAVLARENTLVAYYLGDPSVNEDALIAHLRKCLPDYMLPQRYIHMDAFPLTVNGKVDRQALLQQNIKLNYQPYCEPRTALEKKLCAIWQDVLGIERVSISDDFFKLGGDSIKSMQVMAVLLREGIDCRVRDIFTHRSIAQLAPALGLKRVIDAESGLLTGHMNLLPVQSWFFEQKFPEINHWNQSFLVRVPPLSIDRLNAMLPALIAHHDILRACFPKSSNGSRQQQYAAVNYNKTVKQFNSGEKFNIGQNEFDIEKGPLWAIYYIAGASDGSARLYFSFHHLIIDSVSWRILIEDIKRLYEGIELGDKSSSYRQWVNAMHQYTQKNPQEILFWQNQALENFQTAPLSTTPYFASFMLQPDITEQLIGAANNAYHTEINDLLLTALGLSLSSYFGKSSHRITLEGHGREEIDDKLDISRTVGWFTSMYPVMLTAQKDIASSIVFLKEYLRTIPNKGIGYGAFKYASDGNNTLSDLPNITFNYLGQFDHLSGYWQVVRETLGENVHSNNNRPHILDITGSIINGSLHFSLSSYLSQAAADQITELLEKQLIAVTNHCLSAIKNGHALFTPSDFPFVKISADLLNKLQQKDKKIEAILPANSLQQGFVYHAITQPESDAYRVQLMLDYYTPLNIDAYKNAWDIAIKVHPILRTYFNWDERLIQIVSGQGHLNIQFYDLSDQSDKEQRLSEIQMQDRLMPFDLTKPSLMRLYLIKITESHFVLLKNTHHSILDGWSVSILLNQVHAYYAELIQGNKPNVQSDNTYLQVQAYIANNLAKANTYWSKVFQSINHVNDINFLLSYPTHHDAIKTLQIPSESMICETGENYTILQQCVKQTGLTLNTLVQFAWHKLIQIYTGDNKTIVGTTVSGRALPIKGIDYSVGLYINTLPFIISWEDNKNILQQLQEFESQIAGANDHSFVELASLQNNGQRSFQSLIVAEYGHDFNVMEKLKFHCRGTIEVIDYPLALIVYESNHELQLKLKYDQATLRSEKAEQLLSELNRILLQIPNKINFPHHAITILSNSNYQKTIYDSSNTLIEDFHDKTVNRVLESQVLKTPNASKLVFNYDSPRDELEASIYTIWKDILGVDRISIHDDFFRLGGHSILAMHASHRISQKTHLSVLVSDIFKYKTISKLCAMLRKGDYETDIAAVAEKYAPLSFAQERLWFIEQYEEGTDAYHISLVFELHENSHIAALEKALQSIVMRHEVLRTVFIQNEEGIYRQDIKNEPLDIIYKNTTQEIFTSEKQNFFEKAFDLKTDYPIRACFFYLLDSNKKFLTILFHHIAFDAWSKNIFISELRYFYDNTINPNQNQLSQLSIQYDDFSIWQRNSLAKRIEPLMTYWEKKLSGYELLNFPTDYPRPLRTDYHGDTLHFQLSKKVSLALKKFSELQGMTLYTVLLTAFAIVISKYTGQNDLIIGTPTANRQNAQIATLIGFFVNLLPLRIQLDNNQTFMQCLHSVHESLIEAQCYQDLPFSTLIEKLNIEREISRHPLFQILFNVEYEEANNDFHSHWKSIPTENDYQRSKLDLSVTMKDSSDGISATIQYASSLFKKETMARFAAHYERILSCIVELVDKPIASYSILTAAEYKQIIYDWNATDQYYPNDKTIHQLFEEQVLKSPEKIAVIYENKKLTYQELNEKSNQLAHCIRKNYAILPPDTLIAFCLNRSIDMIICIFAILKAGAAYVPIEPNSPTDRIRYVLNDTKSVLLLTHLNCISILKDACPPHTRLFVIDQQDYQNENKNNVSSCANPSDLAYVIYTSGTTGSPKGVMVMHKNLCNIVYHAPKEFFLTENSRTLQFASLAFDASVLQILGTLTIGAQLFIASEKIRQDAQGLAQFLIRHKITYAGIPPVLLSHLNSHDFPDLATVIIAGEASNAELMARWCFGRYLINAYGPTENTIGATVHHYTLNDLSTNIGRPFSNIKVYVLDKQLMPVPIGVTGELYLGGAGVARGYLNQAELTNACFIQNPFKENTRLYKTGDYVRFLPDGNLEFLGRHDFQVKIRGYRIELAEIEQALLKYEGIQQCSVIVFEEKLAAYYVSKLPTTSLALKNYIEKQLPNYMVPNVFIALDAFALTSNGKIDRNALPEPVWLDDAIEYVSPRDELESSICGIWKDIVGCLRVGIHDDFFRLGGHSILAVHASHRISQATHQSVTVADIFKYKTIAKLCAMLRTSESLIDIEPIAKNGSPLSFAQERLWFIEQYEGGTDAYHIPLVLELKSSINISALEHALQAVITRHEVLRTLFIQDENGVYQQHVKDAPIVIIHKKINQDAFLLERQIFFGKPFDLKTEYPIRLCLFNLTDKNARFLIILFHHVAFDAWSKNIFMSELHYFYDEKINEQQKQLPSLKIQYNDFALWQRNIIAERIESLMAYWKTKLNGHELLDFPVDYTRPQMMDYRGDVIAIEIPESLLKKLQALACENQVTLYTILLSAFFLLLSKYTGQDDLIIGTPVVNRAHPQLNNLIGLFVNSLALRIQLQKSDSIEDIIKLVQKNSIEAQLHQDLPFEQLVHGLNLVRDISRHPIFQILFTVYDNKTDILSNAPWTPIAFHEHNQTAKFDLSVSIQINEKNANVSIQYATALFKRETITRIAEHYLHILASMIGSIDQPIESYSLLNPAEFQQIIYDWNVTNNNYPRGKTIQQLFEEQAHKTPDNIAIVFEGEQLTYKELNEKSNQLAHYINEKYKLIGLCVTRSLDLVIGILGILKSGAAFVPIDPSYPKNRIEYIINDTQCELILTHENLRHLFFENKLIFLDEKPYQDSAISTLPVNNASTDLAYIMYTSGTTGFPKGVMIEHRSLVCLHYSALCNGNSATTKGTLWTNIIFDVSLYEIFSLLFYGGQLHILSDEVRLNAEKLFDYILENKITSFYLPPFFVEKISNYLCQLEGPVPIQKVLLSLEPIQVKHLLGFVEKNILITNAYGPTESTVFSTAYYVEDINKIDGKRLPIGKALNNEFTYILDENLLPVPIGVVGELYLGGEGLARGYLNQENLTNERFIVNPFDMDTKLYKTGDLVRWLSDGNIDYVGRSDFQVKIHGVRIELGEIEQTLITYPEIEHGVVIVHEKKLVAYYTGKHIDDVLLHNFLSTRLPDTMQPIAFIYIEKLPLHVNGKLNRGALPVPNIYLNTPQFVPPRNAMDGKICLIWREILNNPEIGITDDFFALGGDSITSIQVISKLRYAEISCSIKDIFQYRTIARLVDHVLENEKSVKIVAEQGILEGEFGLLPIQQWFFEQSFPVPNHWNQSFLVKVPPLSFSHLESVLPQLMNQHDMLRTRFIKNNNNQWEQYYHSQIENFTIEKFQYSESIETNLNAIQRSLNLITGPLWKLSYIDNYPDGSARLFFACHHLVIDIVSWKILINDLRRLYHHEQLRTKTSSYRQWQNLIQSYSMTHQNELAYWHKQVDKSQIYPSCTTHSAALLILDESISSQLIKEINDAYNTKTEDLLLTALAYALHKIIGRNEFAVTLEGHGREIIDECIDVSETVGWFTTLYPVTLAIKNNLSETICHIKDNLRGIPNKGIGYATLLGTKNLPPVYFNYQGHSNAVSDDWTLVSEKTGISIHPDNIYDFMILINVRVIHGKLNVNFGFRLDSACCEIAKKAFEMALRDITTHCLQKINSQQLMYTPGDFKTVNTEAELYSLPLRHDPVAYYYPFEMTSIQKAYALGRHKQFEIGNIANHIYSEYCFTRLEIVKLESALNQLIKAYPEMRTIFNIDNLTQRYIPFDDALYYHIDVVSFDIAYSEEALSLVRNKLTHFVYDVGTYPLFHFHISRFSDKDILHTSFDLMLLDAQTRMKLFTKLTHLYQQENYYLQKSSITFRDYQLYMCMLKSSSWYEKDKKYWKEKLKVLPLRPKLLLSCDPRSIEKPSFKLSKQLISAPVWKKFKDKAEYNGVSYASVLLSLYGFVLSRFSETSDFLITMTLFNRYGIHPDVNNLWGDFTSTNLFGFSRKNGSANDFFKYTHNQLWDDIAHALYTGLDVQRDLMNTHQLEPTMAVSPIVFTCIVGETKNHSETLPYFISADEAVDKRYWIGQTSQAWIDLQATERDGCFSSGWLYVSQLFSDEYINTLNNAYCNLIEYLAEHSWDAPLPELILPDSQKLLINVANGTHQALPVYTLVSLFEYQAHKRPNSTAVIDKIGTYDYRTLQEKSKSLAYFLNRNDIGQNQLIAVLCEKGFNQVVATLGIMKAGAAYLPLNVEWPLGRIKEILNEGHVSHLLVSEMQWDTLKNTPLINDYHIHRIELMTLTEGEKSSSTSINPNDPAYVIYTSGSTGKPKGVCISHAGAVNTLLAVNEKLGINENDAVLALSELSFDLSVYDFFGVLAAGGVIVFPDQLLSKEPSHWVTLIEKHKITLWNSVPQLMQLLLDNTKNNILYLRNVLLSGDWVPLTLALQVKALPSQPTVLSLGGATEASVWSIWYEIARDEKLNSVPYGFPMPNQNVYVLNAFGEHCPIDLAGEIYLGGNGLALRYWHDDEKTKQRFISHPKLGRLYKTGDLGKWNAAGFIEFLGRQDNQVKRNGNRIELDEIAAKLIQIKGVDNALVCMRQDRLIAYLIFSDFKSKTANGFNVQQFKLAQHGLRPGLTSATVFDETRFVETDYRLQKSYRQFSSSNIPNDLILLPISQNNNKIEAINNLKNLRDLGLLLSVLSAKKLDDKALPKYLYPSAGSTYAVQCIVHIPFQLEKLPAGCYYYHPVLHSLQRTDDDTTNTEFCIEFSVNREAIEPLYGKDALRLAHLECGHMIYLLTNLLAEICISSELRVNESKNANYLATLILNTREHQDFFKDKLNTLVLHKKNPAVFKYKDREYNFSDQSILMQTSELGHILNSAQALVVFEGDDNFNGFLQAGFEAQRCIGYWKTINIAFCPLGLRPYGMALYALAVGYMRPEDKLSAETHASGPDFSDVLLKSLSQHLPCYMLPHVFMPIESFPLTANGKIDFQALPLPDFSSEVEAYSPPRTDTEKMLCAVWQEVLDLPRVSITDDFFRIGGDSILSIHVATKLSQLGIQCDVLSIFEYRTIDRLAPYVKVGSADESKCDDTQIDFHADITDELLERLQYRYEKDLVG
ncbi:MAG: amino acid adenylation domain-containing protein [Gammaproteobacteria bacterium]|nr:amino acid adenylation domain-containing protein [Gammaproteobacteria bacterium]